MDARFPEILELLKFRPARDSWKRLYITDICHAGDVHNGPIKTQSEAGVRDGSPPADIEIPEVVIKLSDALFGHAVLQYVKPMLALRTSDDLSHLWHQDIHSTDRFAVVIDFHIRRIVGRQADAAGFVAGGEFAVPTTVGVGGSAVVTVTRTNANVDAGLTTIDFPDPTPDLKAKLRISLDFQCRLAL